MCYHGSNELCNIAGGPRKVINFNLKFYLYLPEENKESKL